MNRLTTKMIRNENRISGLLLGPNKTFKYCNEIECWSCRHKLFPSFFQSDAGWEEYYDYIFPEDAANQPNLKLLAMAKMWKRKQMVENEVPEETEAPMDEETTSPSSDDPAAPPEKLPENDSDGNTATEKEQEKTYDDRDDDDSSSSSSSESDSNDEKDGEEDKKESRSGDEDKDKD